MYLGNFDSFRFTAASDISCNTIIKAGELVGVTKANTLSGETGLAFLGVPVSVYSFTVSALAAAKDQGAAVYLTSDGAIAFATAEGSVQIGALWEAASSGATEIKVALR